MASECLKLITAASIFSAAPLASGHHSPIIFDRDAVVAFHGTVSRFDWSSPHSYIYVETEDADEPVEWRIETDAVPILTRSGWTPETLQPGDRISVRGRPDRNPSRRNALLMSLRTEDGTVLTSVPGRTDSTTRASDLSGQWQQLVPWNQFLERFAEVELTEKALAAGARYDPRTQDPVADCIGYPPPAAQILLYYVNEVDIQDDRVVMRSEFFDTERTVYTDGRGHPENGERTNEGHSIGWWENGVLVVDTTHFSDYRSTFPGTGVPSGAQKHLVERYALSDDGKRIMIDFVLEDPEYLAEPFTGTIEWHYVPDLEAATVDCTLYEARRFMSD